MLFAPNINSKNKWWPNLSVLLIEIYFATLNDFIENKTILGKIIMKLIKNNYQHVKNHLKAKRENLKSFVIRKLD